MARRTEPDGGELSASEEGDAKEGEEEPPTPPEPSIYPPLAPGFMRVRQADGKVHYERLPILPASQLCPPSTKWSVPVPPSASQHRPALTLVTHLAPGVLPASAEQGRRVVAALLRAARAVVRGAQGAAAHRQGGCSSAAHPGDQAATASGGGDGASGADTRDRCGRCRGQGAAGGARRAVARLPRRLPHVRDRHLGQDARHGPQRVLPQGQTVIGRALTRTLPTDRLTLSLSLTRPQPQP